MPDIKKRCASCPHSLFSCSQQSLLQVCMATIKDSHGLESHNMCYCGATTHKNACYGTEHCLRDDSDHIPGMLQMLLRIVVPG